MTGPALELRVSLRLFSGGAKCFGPGPAFLLEATDRLGSLRAAAAEADMAYSKAWTSLRACEQALGFPLLEREAGGRRGGGSHLTREGRALLETYRALERRMAEEGDRLLRELLPSMDGGLPPVEKI